MGKEAGWCHRAIATWRPVSISLRRSLQKDFLPRPSNALEPVCVLNFKSPAAKGKSDSNPNRYNLMLIAQHTK